MEFRWLPGSPSKTKKDETLNSKLWAEMRIQGTFLGGNDCDPLMSWGFFLQFQL